MSSPSFPLAILFFFVGLGMVIVAFHCDSYHFPSASYVPHTVLGDLQTWFCFIPSTTLAAVVGLGIILLTVF